MLAYVVVYDFGWGAAVQLMQTRVSAAVQSGVGFMAALPGIPLFMFTLAALFEFKGFYRFSRGESFFYYAGIIVSRTMMATATAIIVSSTYQPPRFSDFFFVVAGVYIIIALSASRLLLLGLRQLVWSRGMGLERVLVVGGHRLGHQVMNGIAAQPRMGYKLLGFVADDDTPLQNEQANQRRSFQHLGHINDLERIILTRSVSQVILALPFWQQDRLPHLIETCRELGVQYSVAPDFYNVRFERANMMNAIGVPLIDLKDVSLSGWKLWLKRAFDIGLILLSSPVSVPLSLVLALLIRLDSKGPILFRQTRVGKNGKHFTCFKFRTMVPDAEARKAELLALNEADGPLFKIREDPRITRVGRFLRKSSLDELPQLLNVLRGEMSLVGPRPGLPDEVARYEPWQLRRLEVTPGLTGLWQVMGRSNMTFDEMVSLDIYYAKYWSVDVDMRILWMTIPAVMMSKGAY